MRSAEERFLQFTRFDGDCLVWTGTAPHGYGSFWHEGRKVRAHRVCRACQQRRHAA